MSDFKRLKVWQKSHALTIHTFIVTKKIRGAEYTSLKSQLMRAGISISANIVEGSSQESPKEFIRFLRISLNSAAEHEYHTLFANDIGAMAKTDFISLQREVSEVQKMLNGLIRYLKKPPRKPDSEQQTP